MTIKFCIPIGFETNTVTTVKEEWGRKKELIQVIYECSISLNTLSLKCNTKIYKHVQINLKEIFAEEQARYIHALSVPHR